MGRKYSHYCGMRCKEVYPAVCCGLLLLFAVCLLLPNNNLLNISGGLYLMIFFEKDLKKAAVTWSKRTGRSTESSLVCTRMHTWLWSKWRLWRNRFLALKLVLSALCSNHVISLKAKTTGRWRREIVYKVLLYLLDVLRLTQLPLKSTECIPLLCRSSKYTLNSIQIHADTFPQSALMESTVTGPKTYT